MPEIGSTYLTLLDYAKRVKPTGGIMEIIEVLAATNPVLADANVMEGNLTTGHRSTQRTTQPSGSWRRLNEGVAPEKSTTKQIDDQCGMLEAYSQLDVDLAALNGDGPSFRASEDNAFVAGLNSTAATALFYGNQGTDPEQIQGFAPRYNDLDGDYASQLISAGGSGSDNASIWLVTWGPKTASMIYPKGTKAGLTSEDLGKSLVRDTDGKMYQAWVTKFQWKLGLSVLDYRHVIRIPNIDVSDLVVDAASGADIIEYMVKAYWAMPTETIAMNKGKMAKTFFYCNKTIGQYLHFQAANKANVNLTLDTAAGEPVTRLLGIPIHICDNLTSAEATVTT